MVDAATIAGLGAPVVRPPFLAWVDVLGDPVRATTWETSITPVGTGDPDLDGHMFDAVSPRFVDVGAVTVATGGSDQVVLTLSGIVGPDSDLLDVLGDPSRWKGRVVRLWWMLLDEDRITRIGVAAPYYTGRMMSMAIKGSPAAQKVELTVESYLASLTAASNRTYLDQQEFDGSDQSASLTIAVANGATRPSVTSTLPVGGAGGGSPLRFDDGGFGMANYL